MEFSCRRENLSFGVKIAGRALGTGSNLPILSGMKFEVMDDRLKLQATDLQMTIRCAIPIENRGENQAVVLNGDLLAKITQTLPAEEVEIYTVSDEENRAELKCGGVTFDLFLLPLEDYPEISALPEAKLIALDKDRFQQSLYQTEFAALSTTETSRLSLTGVNLLIEDDRLRLVATNGYRLALKEQRLDTPSSAHGAYLIDARALKELDRILAQIHEDQVDLYHENDQLFFQVGEIVLIAKLIEERFPDFERVIPRQNEIDITLNRPAFLDALRRIEITAAEESGAVILDYNPTQGAIRISSSSSDKGMAEEELAVVEGASEPIQISFKAEYLMDALRVMETEEVTLWLAAPEGAGLLEPTIDAEAQDAPDAGYRYVAMPIRLD
ncbi:MAG: DNA polymerase III subunit beta [Candidatus Bipolaricaulia bacterium]